MKEQLKSRVVAAFVSLMLGATFWFALDAASTNRELRAEQAQLLEQHDQLLQDELLRSEQTVSNMRASLRSELKRHDKINVRHLRRLLHKIERLLGRPAIAEITREGDVTIQRVIRRVVRQERNARPGRGQR